MDMFSSAEWMTVIKSTLFLGVLGAACIVLRRRPLGNGRIATRTLAVREQLLLTRDTRVVVITRGAAHEWVLVVGPQGMQLLAAGGREGGKMESPTKPLLPSFPKPIAATYAPKRSVGGVS